MGRKYLAFESFRTERLSFKRLDGLSHLFDQVKIYEQANQCSNSLYAIFYFSQGELEIVEKMLSKTNTKNLLGESVFLIDCRNDNKPSASTV